MSLNVKLFALGALFLAVSLMLAACGNGSARAQAIDGPSFSTASDRPMGPNFTVATGPNSSFSLSEHIGDIVVLYFSFPG